MPDPTPQQVLDALSESGKPVSIRDLARRLELDAAGRRGLKELLGELLESGEVVKIRGSRVGLPERMNLVVGRLTCNPAGFGFVIPERRQKGQGDVFVPPGHLKAALHGDRVVARVERVTSKGTEGRVIRVLEHAVQRLVGRFEPDERWGGHLVPFDRRILHEVTIPEGDDAGAESGEMVMVEITRPPTAKRNPSGRVIERLGPLDEPGVDLKVVMAKHGLVAEFPEAVIAELVDVPSSVGDLERRGRTDFREQTTITIDPASARDHDDAISIERRAGGWRLGVHIADVAHYLKEGSQLDQEAFERGTSIYFPDTVVPMLPHALSSGICSLVEGEDRLVQSALIDFDRSGRLDAVEFHDGVIRSAAKLSYQDAQAIVDGDAAIRRRFAAVVDQVVEMDRLAKLLRGRRVKRGSLDFDVPEPRLILDAEGEMIGITAVERLDSMKMIEEFMLAANDAVAEYLTDRDVPTLFRVHEPPDLERVEEFSELAASLGYRIPTHLDKLRPQDFQRVLRQAEGRPEEKLVSYLLLRTLKLARYHEENLGHFGLATDRYLHFTSPIRRYPDLVVHRTLRRIRHGKQISEESQAALPDIALHLSDQERRADEASRELVEWKKVRFMADKLGEQFAGYVTGVQSFGLFVELRDLLVQGLVHVSSMTDDYYEFNDKAHSLRGESTGTAYRLGDEVEIQVARVDLERRQVDFVLVDVLRRARARGRSGAPRQPRKRPRRTPRRS